MFTSDAAGLLHALVLNTVVIAAVVRFVRRRVSGAVDILVDGLLLLFLVQYLIVGAAGLVGFLRPSVISTLSVAVALVLALWPVKKTDIAPKNVRPDRLFHAGGLFVFGFALAIIWLQRSLPPMANDALTYHLPAAIKWIQDGRFSLLDTWFYNPANTYSPLAGSVWIAWWMLPTHDDTLARFVQLWPWIGLFGCAAGITRALIGARWNGAEYQPRAAAVACLAGAALVLSRPFVSQLTLAKDDLFTAFFFGVIVLTLTRRRVTEPAAAWRVGVALGLMLATKFTALMSLPVLLLMIDAPWRAWWRWKKLAIVCACVLVLAGPWYLRNWVAFGNPLFPQRVTALGHELWPGLVDLSRSLNLTTVAGVKASLVGSYYSLPFALAAALLVGWVLVLITARRAIFREPLVRVAVIGAAIGIGLFVARSPYAEIRFVYPSLLLLFACAGAAGLMVSPKLGVLGAVVLAGICVATGFNATGSQDVAALVRTFLLSGIILATAGAVVMRLPGVLRFAAVGLTGLFILVFVLRHWDSYIQNYRKTECETWETQYGPIAGAWQSVADQVPSDATLAYTNTYLLRPLYGPTFARHVIYAPVRPGVGRLADIPPVQESVGGEQLIPYVVRQMTTDADEQVWLANLRQSSATHLLVVAGQSPLLLQNDPIELRWANANPTVFKPIVSIKNTAMIYEIRR